MTEIASHRGGALLWPENSRTAFENTIRLPVEQVEFDIHPTADGRLVVIHDATLDRTTDGTGPVHAHTHAELARLTLKGTQADRILLLDEVIDIFLPTAIKLRVELKAGPGRVPYPGLPAQLVRTLAARGVLERSILTSFQIETVAAAAAQAPLPLHVFLATPEFQTDIGLAGLAELALSRGVPMLGIRWNMLDRPTLDVLRGRGLRVGSWATNDAEAIDRMLDLGVDVFTSDRPDLALRARAERRLTAG